MKLNVSLLALLGLAMFATPAAQADPPPASVASSTDTLIETRLKITAVSPEWTKLNQKAGTLLLLK